MSQNNRVDEQKISVHDINMNTSGNLVVREVYVNAGAGFVVAITGSIMTMPGLPKVPAANGIDVNEDGVITGLF